MFVGVNLVKRKLAAHDNLKIIIQQEDQKFTVKESSTFRTIEIVFMLGVDFDYSLADGTELHVRESPMTSNALIGQYFRKYR